GQHVVYRTSRSRFNVRSPEHQAGDAGMHHRARTHDAGLDGTVQSGVYQAVIPLVSRCLAQRNDFCMGSWIVCRDRLIEASADHGTGRNYDCTDGNFAGSLCLPGLVECQIHVVLVCSHVHACMLHLHSSAMRLLSKLAFLLFLSPLSALAQPGVRMSSDFLPLEVGNRWVYDVLNEGGQKIGNLEFAVQDYRIVGGRSFYMLTQFPFAQDGAFIKLVRYDRQERQYM